MRMASACSTMGCLPSFLIPDPTSTLARNEGTGGYYVQGRTHGSFLSPLPPAGPMDSSASDIPVAPADTSNLVMTLAQLARAVERTADILAMRIAPALERIAATRSEVPEPNHREQARAKLRAAMAGAHWEYASELIGVFTREYPDDSELVDLSDTLERGRAGQIEALRGRLAESRQAEDPDAVLGARDELAQYLDGFRLAAIDQDVLNWMLSFIQGRMRNGTVGLDIALWAGRVVERYGTTDEGMSLRASLPILRRCAGLCAHCGEPYTGLEAACPRCQAEARRAAAEAAVLEAVAEDHESAGVDDEDNESMSDEPA